MSFDGSFTHSMKNELHESLSTGRVSKINQPYANELILTIRSHGKNKQLLLSANPTYARVQITDVPAANPRVPNNFTMVIRKYLSGAILNSVSQLDNDRVMYFDFTSRNELGDLQNLRLVVEIMARHSNIILISPNDNKIIDAVKHVGSDVNRYRMIIPGATYINPPKQDMIDPFKTTDFSQIEKLVRDFPNFEVLAQELKSNIQGLGNDTALALANALHVSSDVKTNFTNFFEQFNAPKPTLTESNNKLNFTAFPYDEKSADTFYPSLSVLLDIYFKDNSQRERVREQGATLIRIVKNHLKKNRTKLKKLSKELQETDKADDYKIKGEILTTYLHEVTRGMTEVELPNFYEENKPLKISLSNQISPSENAQKYFKHYQKLKNAIDYLDEQIKITKQEIDYFENIQSQIELADPKDLADIRYEFEQQGYLRNHEQHKNKKKKPVRQKINKPEVFYASDGTQILVGKNNLQNDQLTLHTADKRDTWLHAKDIPGSHVIIKDYDPSEETISEAAKLAAFFSKARNSSKVPVDYLKVKQIRKPNGAKPGFVVYEGQNTINADPDEDFVNSLSKKTPTN